MTDEITRLSRVQRWLFPWISILRFISVKCGRSTKKIIERRMWCTCWLSRARRYLFKLRKSRATAWEMLTQLRKTAIVEQTHKGKHRLCCLIMYQLGFVMYTTTCVCVGGGGGSERERERDIQTDRDRQTDRQTDRQRGTERKGETQTDRESTNNQLLHCSVSFSRFDPTFNILSLQKCVVPYAILGLSPPLLMTHINDSHRCPSVCRLILVVTLHSLSAVTSPYHSLRRWTNRAASLV